MSSRKEEKERRRAERLAREAAARRAEARRRRLRLVGGGALAVAVLAAATVAIASGIGGAGKGGEGEVRQVSDSLPTLPQQQTGDLKAAAKVAGCKLADPPDEGADHADRTFTAADYKSNPPTSGNHRPMPAEDGVYDPGSTPDLGALVHNLEHSRIHVQYRSGTPPDAVAKLEAFVAENDGYHTLLYENPTNMPYAVAATAWNHVLGCDEVNDKTWDALRTFRTSYVDQGPEQVP